MTQSDSSRSPYAQDGSPNREPVRVVLTGSRTGVTSTIHLLYSRGFGHPGLWSPLLRTPAGDQLYSVFTRWITRRGAQNE